VSAGVVYWVMLTMFIAGSLFGWLLRELGVGK